MPIVYKEGDATDYSAASPVRPLIIAHVCNNVGGWGAGFTGALDKRFGARPRDSYRAWYDYSRKESAARPVIFPGEFTPRTFLLGLTQLVRVGDNVYIANMIAQNGLYSSSNPVPLQYLELHECLENLRLLAGLMPLPLIQMPRIGAGLARGNWAQISAIIEDALPLHEVHVLDLPGASRG